MLAADKYARTHFPTALAWYVARTKARQENQVSVVLDQRGIEAYVPKVTLRGKWGRLAQPEPLFPSYLFVKLDLSTDWRRTRSAPGVAYLLGGDDCPTALSEEIVEGIRRRVARYEEERRQPLFRRGEKVVIVEGPFVGLEAVFDRDLSAHGRSRVLVEFVGRLVPAEVKATGLRRLNQG